MSFSPTQNGNYPVKKHSTVFLEGQENKSLNILLQGKMDVFLSPVDPSKLSGKEIFEQSFKVFELDQNVILGANDLFLTGKHSFSYRTSKDSVLFMFFAKDNDQIKNLVDCQKDYAAYLISSIASVINAAYPAYTELKSISRSLNVLCDNLLVAFWYLKEKQGFSCTPGSSHFSEGLNKLEMLKNNSFAFPLGYNRSFLEDAHFNYEEEDTSFEDLVTEVNYYKHFTNIPIEARKSFFSHDFEITRHHCKQAGSLMDKIVNMLKCELIKINYFISRIIYDKDDCIINEFIIAAEELKKAGSDFSTIQKIISYAIENLQQTASTLESKYCHKFNIDFDYFISIVNMLSMTPQAASGHSEDAGNGSLEQSGGTDYVPEELKNSAEKILVYSEIAKPRADLFRINLEAFRNLKDKNSSSEDARAIRSAVASVFFEIYEAVFTKALKENNNSRLINMFLNFAYMDELLLDTETSLTLYKYAGSLSSNRKASILTMRDWLTGICNLDRNPSVNEFGQDYFDVFREMKKSGQVNDSDKEAYDNNISGRLKHEIYNMFKVNHRICHGQTGTYFPILHREMFTRNITKALLTPESVSEKIRRILDIDFSAFHREVFYANPAKNIEKELIMKSVAPDFILMPIYGSRAIMWQEISGRNRSAPGRMLIPIFTGENPDDMLVRLIGNFRWELCRTMMGTSWNDITQSSITSDYTDYIQFFKKNRDLSDEAKEKIKAQIARHNNRLREIFTSDYELWINFEAKGLLRLNKAVRSILFKHCPFSKDIRALLERQPAYSDIALQFNNMRAKKVKELENRYNMLRRSGITPDPEMEENLKFYMVL